MDFKKGDAVTIDGRTALVRAVKWNMVQVQYGDGMYQWVEIKRVRHA